MGFLRPLRRNGSFMGCSGCRGAAGPVVGLRVNVSPAGTAVATGERRTLIARVVRIADEVAALGIEVVELLRVAALPGLAVGVALVVDRRAVGRAVKELGAAVLAVGRLRRPPAGRCCWAAWRRRSSAAPAGRTRTGSARRGARPGTSTSSSSSCTRSGTDPGSGSSGSASGWCRPAPLIATLVPGAWASCLSDCHQLLELGVQLRRAHQRPRPRLERRVEIRQSLACSAAVAGVMNRPNVGQVGQERLLDPQRVGRHVAGRRRLARSSARARSDRLRSP